MRLETEELEGEEFEDEYPIASKSFTEEDNLSLLQTYRESKDEDERDDIRSQIIEGNHRLVYSVVNSFCRTHLSSGQTNKLREDFVQEASLALIRAIDDFDPTRGVKFSSFSSHYMVNAIKSFLSNDCRLISLPSHVLSKIKKVQESQNELRKALARDPNPQEISDDLGDLSPEEVGEILSLVQTTNVQSLEAKLSEEADSASFGDMVASDELDPESQALQMEQIEFQKEAFDALTEREKDILLSLNPIDGSPKKTLSDLSKKYGISIEGIRQVKEKALKKMKTSIEKRYGTDSK